MNPCQGHLLELKLAAIKSLSHAEAFRLFGQGFHHQFKQLLDTTLGPLMSSEAYAFWKRNSDFGNLFETGSSGLAIRAFRFLIWAKCLDCFVEQMCAASTIDEQVKIWERNLRKHLLGRRWFALINSYKFAWDALGVPKAQFEMLLREGTAYDYIVNTFDPLIRTTLLRSEQYFYHLCLRGCYVGYGEGECPGYLTLKGFEHLQKSGNLSAYRIHTDSILNVLQNCIASPGQPTLDTGLDKPLTKAILMDHLDWYICRLDSEIADTDSRFVPQQANEEIEALAKKMASGGRVLLRSSSKKPWYLQIFVKNGFWLAPVGIRMSDRESQNEFWQVWLQNEISEKFAKDPQVVRPCIDRVNMYASTW